jgi:hypothetical protein
MRGKLHMVVPICINLISLLFFDRHFWCISYCWDIYCHRYIIHYLDINRRRKLSTHSNALLFFLIRSQYPSKVTSLVEGNNHTSTSTLPRTLNPHHRIFLGDRNALASWEIRKAGNLILLLMCCSWRWRDWRKLLDESYSIRDDSSLSKATWAAQILRQGAIGTAGVTADQSAIVSSYKHQRPRRHLGEESKPWKGSLLERGPSQVVE